MKRAALLLTILLATGSVFAGDALPDEPVTRASVDWLINILPRGGDEVAEKYVGKTLLIEGWVEEMGRDAGGWHVIVRRLSARSTHTRCYFPPGSGQQLDYLYKGAPVEVIGVCQGYDEELDAVVLRNSRLVVRDFNQPDEE